jgi:hypothetical protein
MDYSCFGVHDNEEMGVFALGLWHNAGLIAQDNIPP